ncbi:MAG: 16S rRNA (uracil(1498)-N(3))-methyltransferase [Chlamydiales bacterium]|nr:16S rRNA (uracil(1498)-N(3))-methyltransferase [Chlamydiales bacterium]
MPHDRFYSPETFSTNMILSLPDDEAHHLRVMRGKAGTQIELVNGMGQLSQATVEAIDKRHTSVRIASIQDEPLPTRQIILAQAVPKLSRLDTIVEKGTELGMTQLWLFPGQRSEKSDLSHNQRQRVQFLAVSALKQCGRLHLPKIEYRTSLAKWTELPPIAFFGDVEESAPPFQKRLEELKPQDVIFFVGPEAGFSSEEIAHLKQLGAHGVSLHKNILRTDTAPLAALSLISHWLL